MEMHNSLLDEFRNRRISRRDFVSRMLACGVTLSAAMSLADRAIAESPKRGGHLTFGSAGGETGDNLDPSAISNQQITVVRCALRNTLTEVDASGKLVSSLAESWETSTDAKTWSFKLRSGVEFHDGKTLTSADVVDSINLHRGEESKSAGKPLLEAVKDVRRDGKDRVQFELEAGNADFPFILSQYFFQVVPSYDGALDTMSGNGTGPFVIKEFEPGVRFEAERNPNYFLDGRPFLDSITILTIRDSAARSNSVITGEVDVIDNVDVKTVGFLEQVPGVKLESVPSGAHYTIPMNCKISPFDNNDVRLAMKYSFDRQELVTKLRRGYAVPANDHPISPNDPFFNRELAQREYDPDKAKFHLKKAGYSTLDIKVHTSDAAFAEAVDSAILFKENAARSGINMEVVRVPADGYWSNVWLNEAVCYVYWNGRPTADLMFTTVYHSEAKWNEAHWQNQRFDDLLVQARTELDQQKRREMYWEMQELLHDQGGSIIPAFFSYIYAASEKIGMGTISGQFLWDNNRAPERWWRKS